MFSYHTTTEWKGGDEGLTECGSRPPLTIFPPPEFGGKETEWSPEDLLAASVESCLLLSLKFWVNRGKVDMKTYSSKTRLDMDRTPQGLRFQGCEIEITATVGTEEDIAKLEDAAHKAEGTCPVSNALNFAVKVAVNATVA